MSAGRQRVTWWLWTLALLCLIVTAGGIAGLDAIVAGWTSTLPRHDTLWSVGTSWLDLLALKTISNFLLGFVLLLAAGGLLVLRSTRSIGWSLLYLGAVQFSSTVIADLAKPLFGRVRPFEAAGGSGGDIWFVGANSFPSGHVAFYAGLFLALTMLFPRWFALWAIPLLFVSAARILEQDHYLGDVTASIALASLMAIAFRFILARADES